MNITDYSQYHNTFSTSFKATLYRQIFIKKKLGDKFVNYPAQIVKLNIRDQKDIKTLTQVAEKWDKAIFIKGILLDIVSALEKKNKNLGDIYAITTQNKRYNDLDFKKILGISEFVTSRNEDSRLKFLETNPLYANNKKNEFTNIGTGFLSFFKSFNKPFDVVSSYTATSFYEKNNLVLIDPNNIVYKWIPKKKKH